MRVKEPLWVKRPRSRVPMPNISYITRNTIVYMEAVLIFSAHANDAGHSYTRLTSDCVVARHTSCFTTRDGSGSGTSKLRIISKKACNLRYTFLPWSFTKNAPAGVATYKNMLHCNLCEGIPLAMVTAKINTKLNRKSQNVHRHGVKKLQNSALFDKKLKKYILVQGLIHSLRLGKRLPCHGITSGRKVFQIFTARLMESTTAIEFICWD